MQADTFFPDREEAEETYRLSPEYKSLFARVWNTPVRLSKTRRAASITNAFVGGLPWPCFVLWPPAPPLRRPRCGRARPSADTDNPDDANEVGQRSVLDLMDDESPEGMDLSRPGPMSAMSQRVQNNRRRLLDMARAADALKGEQDEKLKKAVQLVKSLLDDGFRPIVFCRFIPTAEYVADELRPTAALKS